MKTKSKKISRHAPSVRITVRWHADEIKKIDKERKAQSRSEHIRSKTLDKTEIHKRNIKVTCNCQTDSIE